MSPFVFLYIAQVLPLLLLETAISATSVPTSVGATVVLVVPVPPCPAYGYPQNQSLPAASLANQECLEPTHSTTLWLLV